MACGTPAQMQSVLDIGSRFAVLGDVHTEDKVLEQCLSFAKKERGLSTILCVGDMVDGMGDADRTCDLLQEHGVLSVRGNHERWLLTDQKRHLPHATQSLSAKNRQYLKNLHPILRFKHPSWSILLCHAVGEDDEVFLRPDTTGYGLRQALSNLKGQPENLWIGGHTHEIMVRTFGDKTFVNAGTLHRNFPRHILEFHLDNAVVTFWRIEGKDFLETTVKLRENYP